MVKTTLLYGVLITGLGIIGYLATGQASKTALIPCVFGLPVIALGILSWTKPNVSRQTRIAALIIALMAFGGTARGLGGLVTLMTNGTVARPSAVIVQAIMAIASLIYIVLVGFNLLQKSTSQN